MTSRHIAAAAVACAALLLTGCATPPDGSKFQRLPELQVAPVLSADEARRLGELNAKILAEQNQARIQEEAAAAQRARDARLYWGLSYGVGPGWHRDWMWNGSRWVWRPLWGVELWGPWAY